MTGIKMVLFDLDGTLLPMNMDEFTNGYFGLLCKKMIAHGYEPNKLIESIWSGTKCMVMNDGSITNEDAFWKRFVEIYGEDSIKDKNLVDDFYSNEFDEAKKFCGNNPKIPGIVKKIKEKGYRVALATNPIFPKTATQTRIKWSGCKEEDFEIFTTYENSSFSKPNLAYYSELIEKLNVKAEECLMVGNDVNEDMIAEKLGMKVFLITDCLLNKDGKDISIYPHGNFDDLASYLLD